MRVTRIEECSKSRVRIFIEEEFAFVLYKGELHSYHILEGEEIGEEVIHSIMKELLPKRAKLRAMNLLMKRDYTSKQLRSKLKDGEYPEKVIEEAIAYVEGCRYVNDLRYAVNFIQGHADSRSRRRLEQDLLGRGIDKDTLERAWIQWEEQGGDQDEGAMIQALLNKKGFDRERADAKERQKMYAFLMRKGFSGSLVRRAVMWEDSGDWS